MAFGKDAAAEMAARIEQRCGAPINAQTFHALGYEIIRQVEGELPALAPHASDEKQFRALLREILLTDIAQDKRLGPVLLRWFSEFYSPYKSEWDFETKDQYYRYVEANELRTLQGEIVRSHEEWEIANWLYLNGIGYEYEPVYEHELPKEGRRVYMPDFRLTESGVYIEHFGVRKVFRGGQLRLETAPFVDRESYLQGMEWKRQVHRDHGTTLIETYSYERVEGRLTEALLEKLSPYATPKPKSAEESLDTLSQMGQVDAFTQILGTFLRHFKSTGLSVEQCAERASKSGDKARGLAFLEIFELVLESYQRRLDGRIDFEDMIIRAAEHVENGRYQSPYRHLLVDEFQDISVGRARLLRALKAQHGDARIFAVGDDWQSIYRFTGSDIHLMRDFGNEFGGVFAGVTGISSTVDLGRTFRSVDKIALPARSFILKNPKQITKRVVPSGQSDAPAIKIAYYERRQEGSSLRQALEEIQKRTTSEREASVLLLGRYHFVRPVDLPGVKASFPGLSIRFMTVHASKGLEADHVVVLHAVSGRLGFPSEIVDDPLLDMVLPEPEQFSHAEERRLFYVALTRARKTLTVLADKESPSVFVQELIENGEYGVIELGSPSIADRRCGQCGGRMLTHRSKNGKLVIRCEHGFLCGEKLRACSVCGEDLPVKDSSNPNSIAMVCSCGARFPVCPECGDGWLVERKGRYGKFLGCVNYPACNGSQRL
jgi:DNA helicase-4